MKGKSNIKKRFLLYKVYTSAYELPTEIFPNSLIPRQGTIIPSPPFDLSNQLPTQQLNKHIGDAWEQAAASPFLFIAHALSLASQRRVLGAYFVNADTLTARQLIKYSPFTILAVRQLISGTLIATAKSEYKNITRNSIGFLLKVPPCCLHTVSFTDANSPKEKLGISQAQFRKLILEENATLNQSYIHLTPNDLLSSSRNDTYNEIAFIPRALNPNKTITICGVFLDESNLNFDLQQEKGDPVSPHYYFQLMHELSDLLRLPLVRIN